MWLWDVAQKKEGGERKKRVQMWVDDDSSDGIFALLSRIFQARTAPRRRKEWALATSPNANRGNFCLLRSLFLFSGSRELYDNISFVRRRIFLSLRRWRRRRRCNPLAQFAILFTLGITMRQTSFPPSFSLITRAVFQRYSNRWALSRQDFYERFRPSSRVQRSRADELFCE